MKKISQPIINIEKLLYFNANYHYNDIVKWGGCNHNCN